MNAIVLQNVTKHFKKQTVRGEYTTFKTELLRLLRRQRKLFGEKLHIEALKGIDLVIPKGKTLGLVGRNGSGKSTLLKLITGIYSPTSGAMSIEGRISALLDLGAGFHPDFTGRENILINGIILGMSRSQVKARMEEIIAFAELGEFIDQPVRTYSSGMYMRLAFAVATHVDPEILIVDEILAVGDEHFSRKSLAKMNEFKKSGKTILLVTHDLGTVQNWCDLAAWIDGGRIRMFGSPADVVAQYRQAVAMAEQQAQETGSSALSAPGLALPELPSTSSSSNKSFALFHVFEISAPGGESIAHIPAHAPIQAHVRFKTAESLKPWTLRVSLWSADDIQVYATDSTHTSIALPLETSQVCQLDITLPVLGLRKGKYTLKLQAISQEGAVIAEHSAVPFEIDNSQASEALIQIPATWRQSESSIRQGAA